MFDDLDTVVANSFFDFHSKGMDYVCLKRTDALTIKAYFFDEDSFKDAAEVVNPHNHRYDFQTQVLAGQLIDFRFEVRDFAPLREDPYQQFSWHTPLNGGTGFQWWRSCWLEQIAMRRVRAGHHLFSPAETNHTIKVDRETVLLLYQFADKIPHHWATNTYVKGYDKEPPSINDLYRKPSTDEVVKRLKHLSDLGVRTEVACS